MKSSDNPSSVKAVQSEIEYRQRILGDIIEEAKIRNDSINENYLLYHMRMKGFENYTRSKLYNDRLTLDSQNNYIRHFLPRYSQYQSDINDGLDVIREEAIALSSEEVVIRKIITRETKDGTFTTEIIETGNYQFKAELLKIRLKVAELKQKHAEGQNVQIAAVVIQKELADKKAMMQKLQEENKQLTIASTKSIPDESEKNKSLNPSNKPDLAS